MTNGSFLEAKNMDGLRKSLAQDFSKIYCFNLRGNGRTMGELCKKEGEPLFAAHGGSGGSLTTIAITIFVRGVKQDEECEIFYHDVGDYLSRKEKLTAISNFGSISSVPWKRIIPNADNDWINQRSPEFDCFIAIGSKDGTSEPSIFSTYSLGVVTNRDPWAFSFSAAALTKNIGDMIEVYNSEMRKYRRAVKDLSKRDRPEVGDVVDSDPKRISWTRGLKKEVVQFRKHEFDPDKIVTSLYRPFTKQKLYFDRKYNEMVYQIPKLFPTPEHKNVVISVIGVVDRKGFSVLATNEVPSLHFLDTSQCFPLYYRFPH